MYYFLFSQGYTALTQQNIYSKDYNKLIATLLQYFMVSKSTANIFYSALNCTGFVEIRQLTERQPPVLPFYASTPPSSNFSCVNYANL